MLRVVNLNSEFMKFGPVSFKAKPGEIIGIEGESGSGKSVLLKAMSDMIRHEGSVFLDDIEQQDIPANEWRKKVSLLPAEVLFWNRLVGDDLINTDKKLFKKLGFDPETILDKNTDDLSSGEKQRIGLLRTLENNPKVLLLDEPSANLDEENKKIMENIISDYLKNNHACIVWVGHDISQLERVSTKIFKIQNNSFGEK